MMIKEEKINFYSLKSTIRRALPKSYYIFTPTISECSWECPIYQIAITEEQKKEILENMSTLFQSEATEDVRLQISNQFDQVMYYALQHSNKILSVTFLKVHNNLEVSVTKDEDNSVILKERVSCQDDVQPLIGRIIESLTDVQKIKKES